MHRAAPSSAGHGARHITAQGPDDEWRLSVVQAEDKPAIQAFIRERFRSAYDAHIRHFLPELLALHRGEALMAACGLRRAATGPLFLETYLDRPVESLLAHRPAASVDRSGVIEVGNLSIGRPGASRHLIAHLTAYLDGLGMDWVVFTAVPALRNNFLRLGIPLLLLATADVARIPEEERKRWGRYYDQRPIVCAVSVSEARLALAA